MTDRFALDDPYDLARNARLYFFPEETHLRDAGDELENLMPRCETREKIVGYSDSVQELATALREHETRCSVCNGGSVELPKAA